MLGVAWHDHQVAEDSALEDLLAPVRERNSPRLLARLDHVRDALVRPPRVVDDDLRADLHALIGALGTLGWASGSVLITDIQLALMNRDPLGRFGRPSMPSSARSPETRPQPHSPLTSKPSQNPAATKALHSPETVSDHISGVQALGNVVERQRPYRIGSAQFPMSRLA